jgi:phosphate transport system ATP-binding protein
VLLVFLIFMNIAVSCAAASSAAGKWRMGNDDDMRVAEARRGRNQTSRSRFAARKVEVFYGDTHAIKDVDVDIEDKTVTAFIGPSGCGKSTFLRCLNRMNDTIDVCRVEGEITLDGEDIYDKRVDPVQLRAKVGMVFQKPNPFPKSIYDNVAYGPRIHGWPQQGRAGRDRREIAAPRRALGRGRRTASTQPGTGLSGGQQQRLCIARAVATEPRGAADGRAVLGARPHRHRQVEELIDELRELLGGDRDPLDAAGRARQPEDRVLPPRRPGRIRRHRRRFSPTPTIRAPKATSPAGSAEENSGQQTWLRRNISSSSFDRDLEAIQANIMRMGGLVEDAIARRPGAGDPRRGPGGSVREGDAAIDALDEQINEEAARIIAQRSRSRAICAPCCRSSASRPTSSGSAITPRTSPSGPRRSWTMPPVNGTGASLRRMARQVELMLKDVLDAYIQRDADLALDVRDRDIEVDQMYSALFREYLTFMMEDPRNITTCMHLHFMAKNIERMGDHATRSPSR